MPRPLPNGGWYKRPIQGCEGKTVLVTGSTDGLGRALVLELARRGATVLVHGRDRERGEAVADAAGGAPLLLADLASLEATRRLADRVLAEHDRLDVLVCNAGLGGTPERRASADGHELTFAVNHLAHFLLALRLLPLLCRSAPARIVNVASAAREPIDFADPMLERGYGRGRAYAQSKLAQILFTIELAERLGPDSGITANALHPATLMDTTMVREAYGRSLSTVGDGLGPTLRLVCDPALAGVSGRWFFQEDEAAPHPQASDPAARRRLWELSERLTGERLER